MTHKNMQKGLKNVKKIGINVKMTVIPTANQKVLYYAF